MTMTNRQKPTEDGAQMALKAGRASMELIWWPDGGRMVDGGWTKGQRRVNGGDA